jgi:2'-5' RNA ligase
MSTLDPSETSNRAFIALVSYIPEPLSSFFYDLRGKLPGDSNPQAHITILPPRPLRVPVEQASQQTLEVLSHFPAFEVELSKVGRFAETNFLYVDIGEGADSFHQLHDSLNQGDLAHEEEFEFRPHLTLGGPVPEAHVSSIQDQAEVAWLSADHPRRFVLDEIVFLWLNSEDATGEWNRLWTYSLRTKGTAMSKAATAAFTNRTS